MNNKNIIAVIAFLGILFLLGYQFFNVLIFIFLSIIMASIGSPLMKLLQKIKFKQKTVPLPVANQRLCQCHAAGQPSWTSPGCSRFPRQAFPR
jgi:hypothetical protein